MADEKSKDAVLAATTTPPTVDKLEKGRTPEDEVSSTDLHDGQHGDWDFSDIDAKKLNRKIDLHVIPWLAVLYLLSFLDRSAIGNARLFGLEKELGMTDEQYKICVSVFYLSYA